MRWDKGDLPAYYNLTGTLLQTVAIPNNLLTADCDDVSCCHGDEISAYYSHIVTILSDRANQCIPVLNSSALKPYWSDTLNELKAASIQAHNVWVNCGKPRSGWINHLRIRCKYKYKLAIKQADEEYNFEIDDEISELFLRKDFDKFWHKWKDKFQKTAKCTTHINGYTSAVDIANEFCRHMSEVYYNSYADNTEFSHFTDQLQKMLQEQDANKMDWNVFSCQILNVL